MSSVPVVIGPASRILRRFFWQYPEWWTVALCCLAWIAMLLQYWRNFGHHAHRSMTFPDEVAGWMLMVAAMMLPLILHSVRTTASGSFWSRRHRAVAGFLGGFFSAWLLFGLVAVAAVRYDSWMRSDAAASLGFLVAALWQRSALHQRALVGCHAIVPLAPRGWRADSSCLRYGVVIGSACVGSCWPLMLACAFTGHSPVAMAGGFLIGTSERWYYRIRINRMRALTLGLAAYYAVLALLSVRPAAAAQTSSQVQVIGSTTAAVTLGKGSTQVDLLLRPQTNPAKHSRPHRARVFLTLEGLTSDAGSPPWLVYLDLPVEKSSTQDTKQLAGEISMYGLAEASRSDDKSKGRSLTERLEITELYDRLSASPGWNGRISITFAPKFGNGPLVRVRRVAVSSMSIQTPRERL